MLRSRRLAAAVVLGVGLLLAHAPAPSSSAAEPEQVIVTNFPETQAVTGSVSVPEPIPQSELVRRIDVIVPSVARSDTTQLTEAGILEAEGFTHVVVGLRGEVQGNLGQDGAVGVLLVPEEPPVIRALREEGRFDFAREVRAEVTRAERGYFASQQTRFLLGFPRYRVLLYNTSDRSVSADVYLYLTN
jgi:hypothetical protein